MAGFTLDSGTLIALERGEKRMRLVMQRAKQREAVVTVPAVVLAEWWRGGTGRQRDIIESIDVEPVTEFLGKLAGEAIAAVGAGPSVVDAVVMAAAAQRGDVVYTSDFDDLERLREQFPGVRLLRV